MSASPRYQQEALQIVARNQVSRVAELLSELAQARFDADRYLREATNCPRCPGLEKNAVELQKEVDDLQARASSVQAATIAERDRIQQDVAKILGRIESFYTRMTAPNWLLRPNMLLGGVSPFQRIAEGRTAEVESLIEQLETGAYA